MSCTIHRAFNQINSPTWPSKNRQKWDTPANFQNLGGLCLNSFIRKIRLSAQFVVLYYS